MNTHQMKKEIGLLKSQFPKLKVGEVDYKFIDTKRKEQTVTYCHLSGLEGNEELLFLFREKKDIEMALKLPLEECFLFKDLVGLYHNNQAEVTLFQIGLGNFNHDDSLVIKLNYKKRELIISISYTKDSKIQFLASHIRGAWLYRFRNPIILKIENLIDFSKSEIEGEIRAIINSVLFDIEYNFNYSFDTPN